MNINLTLLGQIITFMIFVWITMKYVWPPILSALEDRQAQIAKGLQAAEESKRALQAAEEKALQRLQQVEQEAQAKLKQAETYIADWTDKMQAQVKEQIKHMTETAKAGIEHDVRQARQALVKEVVEMAIEFAGEILSQQVDRSVHVKLIDQLSEQSLARLLPDVSKNEC